MLVIRLRKKLLSNTKVSSGFQANGWLMGNLDLGLQTNMLDAGRNSRTVPETE